MTKIIFSLQFKRLMPNYNKSLIQFKNINLGKDIRQFLVT